MLAGALGKNSLLWVQTQPKEPRFTGEEGTQEEDAKEEMGATQSADPQEEEGTPGPRQAGEVQGCRAHQQPQEILCQAAEREEAEGQGVLETLRGGSLHFFLWGSCPPGERAAVDKRGEGALFLVLFFCGTGEIPVEMGKEACTPATRAMKKARQ